MLNHLSQEFETALFRHVAEQGFALPAPLRLQGGRSNHVWRAGRYILKLFATSCANPLFENSAQLEAIALEFLSDTDLAPQLFASGAYRGHRWLLYQHVEGGAWRENTGDVARHLAQLHEHRVPTALPLGTNGSLALTAQTDRILSQTAQTNDLLDLRPAGEVAPIEDLCLIHGDPVPGNIVVDGSRMTFIDWQCPKHGDPAEDLAVFLSPAMQSLYRGEPLSEVEVSAFLEAYPQRAVVQRYLDLRPWFHWRMAAYCCWRGDHAAAALERRALLQL